MKIIKFTPIAHEDTSPGAHYSWTDIFGLGDDQKVYKWKKEEWIIYTE